LFGEPYKRLTERFEEAIATALDLPTMSDDRHKVVKAADTFALLVEARNMMPSGGHRWDYVKTFADVPSRIITPDYFLGEQHWEVSRDSYLQRHEELTHA
jgi:hypothetical protein